MKNRCVNGTFSPLPCMCVCVCVCVHKSTLRARTKTFFTRDPK